jgi:hypothetical protein
MLKGGIIMEWRSDKPVPFNDENEYREFMNRLLQLAIDDGCNPGLATQFFALQRRAYQHNHYTWSIDSTKEEYLFNQGIHNNTYGDPTLEDENEIEP